LQALDFHADPWCKWTFQYFIDRGMEEKKSALECSGQENRKMKTSLIWLVVLTILKNMKVSWGLLFPIYYAKIKFIFQTNNQLWLRLPY
jgi:hypothetical protein